MYSLGSKWLMATLARWHRTEATWYCRTPRAFCRQTVAVREFGAPAAQPGWHREQEALSASATVS